MTQSAIIITIDNKEEANVYVQGKTFEVASMLSLTAQRMPRFKRALIEVANRLKQQDALTEKQLDTMASNVIKRCEEINAANN